MNNFEAGGLVCAVFGTLVVILWMIYDLIVYNPFNRNNWPEMINHIKEGSMFIAVLCVVVAIIAAAAWIIGALSNLIAGLF